MTGSPSPPRGGRTGYEIPYRLAVAGGRDYALTSADWLALDSIRTFLGEIGVLLHGGCRGADLGAAYWAHSRLIPCVAFPVEEGLWSALGPSAGPARNRMMLRSADLLVAFPGGKGTASAIAEAKRRRLVIVELPVFAHELPIALDPITRALIANETEGKP